MDAADYRNVTDHRGKRGRVFCLFCYNIFIYINETYFMLTTAPYSVICVYQIICHVFASFYLLSIQTWPFDLLVGVKYQFLYPPQNCPTSIPFYCRTNLSRCFFRHWSSVGSCSVNFPWSVTLLHLRIPKWAIKKMAPGTWWFSVYVGDEILPNYIGIIIIMINHYKDPC